jgi:hypothetical protein
MFIASVDNGIRVFFEPWKFFRKEILHAVAAIAISEPLADERQIFQPLEVHISFLS